MRFVLWLALGPWLAQAVGADVQPMDPSLIPEARRVLEYLARVYGTASLSGVSGVDNAMYVYDVSGRLPAILTLDLCGWNSPTWGPTYTPVVERAIEYARWWWERGGIVAMQFHWKHPGKPDGTAWVGRHGSAPPSGPFDMANVTRPGTAAHEAFMKDLARHADYLERLAKARVPVLWRPFHEIDGGWFWWTDQETPEHTAAAWRMMADYLTRERGLHNLIWVYSAGVRAGGYHQWLRRARRERTLEDEIEFRRRYYPGAEYCDISGIDIYPNASEGYGDPATDTYPKAWEIMSRVSPGKMLAMCEGAALVHPEAMKQRGPRWLYTLQWWGGEPTYVREVYQHDFLITLDELPSLNPDARPFVRLVAPQDGEEPSGTVVLEADAGARTPDFATVEFLAIRGPWKNWWLMSDREREEAFGTALVLGVASQTPYRVSWMNAPIGFYSVVAKATDRRGRTSLSNVARISVGFRNLARNGRWSASSAEATAARAGDGDLFTGWNGEKKADQWLAVDLGQTVTLRTITIAWWKAYAKSYEVQVSEDGVEWTVVHTKPQKKEFLGNTDQISLPAVTARHVRLFCRERGTDWGGYTVYELGCYSGEVSP